MKIFFHVMRLILILVLFTGFNLATEASTTSLPHKIYSSFTITPTADAYVRESDPDSNYGLNKALYVDNLPVTHSYLRFEVNGINGRSAQSVFLRIYANSSNSIGFTVSRVLDDNWTENTITFNNSPAIGEEISSSKPIRRKTWVEVDVSSLIISDGTYTLAITTTSDRNTYLYSRETGSRAPQLIITIDTPASSTVDIPSETSTSPMDFTETPTPQLESSNTPLWIPTFTDIPVLLSTSTPTSIPDETPANTSIPTDIPILSSSQNQVYFPVADTYVDESMPDHNFGGSSSLRVDASPLVTSYLRFTVLGLSQQKISHVELQMYPNSSSLQGLVIKSVNNNSWNELTITNSNAPATISTLTSTQAVTNGDWITMDVTSYVISEGIYSFNLSTPGSTAINLSSRESGTKSPKLIVSFMDSSTPLVTPTNSTTLIETVTPPSMETIAPDMSTTNLPIPTQTGTLTAVLTNTAILTPTDIPITVPTSTPTNVVTTTNGPTPIGDPVLVGAGDISSCSSTGDEATASLLDGIAGTIFTTGDNAYESGSAAEYANCYNPTWGRFISRTKPSPGNHEYNTSGATGYYDYFGSAAGVPAQGYYSYNLGSWHIIVLNSEISTSTGSTQEKWLRQDLIDHTSVCTLAYWHKPRFSSGSSHGSDTNVQPLWQALFDYHADVVVNGHEHNYERFVPQTPTGVLDANGIREFVAGMGGRSHYGFGSILANSVTRNNDTYGVLKFTLHTTSYDWQFIPEAGKTYADSGSAECIP